MELSVETCSLRNKYNDITALKLIKQAGFDAFDYSFYWCNSNNDMLGTDYLQKAQEIKELSQNLGLECKLAHAPVSFKYSNKNNISDPEFLKIVRSIEFASVIGSKNIVVHAITRDLPNHINLYQYNHNFYQSLIPYANRFNVNILVENLFNINGNKNIPVLSEPGELTNFIKSLNSGRVKICLDIGHLAVTGLEPADVIKGLNNNLLAALHMHDNYGITDQHLLPYMGKIDWDSVANALKTIEYKGDITLELTGYLPKISDDLIPPALKLAEQIGRTIIKKIKN